MRKDKGFTLVEIMVVVAIIGVLTAVVTPQIGSILSKAKISATKAETKSIGIGIINYKSDFGYYPGIDYGGGGNGYSYYYGDAEKLNSYLMAPGSFYLDKKIGLDPWKRGYFYHMYVLSNPYVDVIFYSPGPDGNNSSWDSGLWLTGSFAGDDIGIMLDG